MQIHLAPAHQEYIFGLVVQMEIKITMDCLVVRPGNCYGPHDKYDFDKCHVAPATIKKVVDKHNPIQVWGDGEDIRDFIFVDDFIDGLVCVMENCNEKHEVVNIGSNTSYSINELLDICMEVSDYDEPV